MNNQASPCIELRFNAPSGRDGALEYERDYEALREVERLLPHRAPFLYVDSVEILGGDSIRAYHRFSDKEHFFSGHFPRYPVVPGVILVEAMAQAGGAGAKKMGAVPAGIFFLASIEKAKFRRQVLPGEVFEMRVDNLKASGRSVKQRGKGYVNGELAVEAEWFCLVGEEMN